MIVSIRDLVKVYSDPKIPNYRIPVLKGVSLDFQSKEILYITGKSGSGKSTLIRLIGMLETPTAGSIIIKEKRIETLKKNEMVALRRKEIGIIFQNPNVNLINQLNVERNIRVPMKILSELPGEQQKKRVNELLDLVDLTDKKESAIYQLSGGEKQRIALCIALANKPSIILADEPTGELDQENAFMVKNVINKASLEYECSGLFVTHDLNLITHNDHNYTLESGLLKEQTQEIGRLN